MSFDVGRRVSVLLAIALSAFIFNTTENLPIGLLNLMSSDLGVSLPAAGFLVTGYGLAVAAVSLPMAQLTRRMPRRFVLSGVMVVLAVATIGSVLTTSYGVLLGTRIVVAVAQAVFWAVMGSVAVGLFSPEIRGRVLAVTSVCGSLATLLGVPAGTWLGQHTRWQLPFIILSVLALIIAALIAALLPTTRPEESHAAYGSAPDRRHFFVVLFTTAVAMTGLYTGFTYIGEFITQNAGFPESMVGPLLFVYGGAGIIGVALLGHLLDRHPRNCLVIAVGVQTAAMLVLFQYAGNQAVVIAALALLGLSAAPIFTATQARILHVSPGRTEIGFAANSAAFNVGVAAGAFVGGAVLSAFEVRGAFLVGALLTLATVALLLSEPLLSTKRHRGRAGQESADVARTCTAPRPKAAAGRRATR
ncbi:MFS transporter [Salinispora vitiensis]|uniref:MFS transporter n=1 Tax=Salinispora vitiensis TaxID=999544 RepID=UPI0003806018|nr:MFS transporter [Salinispora vitiensis]